MILLLCRLKRAVIVSSFVALALGIATRLHLAPATFPAALLQVVSVAVEALSQKARDLQFFSKAWVVFICRIIAGKETSHSNHRIHVCFNACNCIIIIRAPTATVQLFR
jgi:hypothetical protein